MSVARHPPPRAALHRGRRAGHRVEAWPAGALLLRHWTAADREAHEALGFHEGWGRCADQLAALLAQP